MLAALDASIARGNRLQLEQQELAFRAQQLQEEGQRLRVDVDAGVLRENLLRLDNQQVREACRRRCAEADDNLAAAYQSLAAARQESASLRQRLAQSAHEHRLELLSLSAVAVAAEAAEAAAFETVAPPWRLRSRAPPKLPSLLSHHLQQTAAGHGSGSRARRTARQLLNWLSHQLA